MRDNIGQNIKQVYPVYGFAQKNGGQFMSRQHFTYLFAEEFTESEQEEIKTKLFPYKLWKIAELDKVTVTKYPTTLRDTKGRELTRPLYIIRLKQGDREIRPQNISLFFYPHENTVIHR